MIKNSLQSEMGRRTELLLCVGISHIISQELKIYTHNCLKNLNGSKLNKVIEVAFNNVKRRSLRKVDIKEESLNIYPSSFSFHLDCSEAKWRDLPAIKESEQLSKLIFFKKEERV